MKRILFLLCFLPLLTFGQYRADRARTNPNVSDGNGYCFRGHWPTDTSSTPVFNPNFDGKLWAWWDFSDTTTMTYNTANKTYSDFDVVQVDDKGDSARNLIAMEPIRAVAYNFNAITTNAFIDGQLLSAHYPITEPFTIYATIKQNLWTSGMALMDGYDVTTAHIVQRENTPELSLLAAWEGATIGISPGSLDSFEFVKVVFNGANSYIETKNGKQVTSISRASQKNGFTIGAFGNQGATTKASWRNLIIRTGADDSATSAYIYGGLNLADDATIYDMWLLMGQSNAQGVGNLDSLPASLKTTARNCIIGGSDSKYYMYNPANAYGAAASQFGLENTFLRNLTAHENKRVFMFKYAQCGTTLYTDWLPPSGSPYILFKIYLNDMCGKLVKAHWGHIRIKGIIWVQGEADATNQTYANAYYANLTTFMDSVETFCRAKNTEMGTTTETFIKVIAKNNCNTGTAPGDTVRAAQARYVANTANSYLIDCDSYYRADGLHYGTAGLSKFGIAVYNAIKND